MENEYNKFKNGISADPINSQNEKNSLEDEYILELNMDEDDFKEILEEDNRECTELVKNAEKNSNNIDEEIDYIIKNAKKEIHIVKAIGEIINREISKNKKISINLIDDYLNLIKDDNLKIKKLLKLKSYNYKYKEIFLLKIAELEIYNITNVSMKDSEDIDEKVNYILSILEQAELLSKNNGTKPYLVEIYLELSELYSIDCEIKNEENANEYMRKAKKIKKEVELERKGEKENFNETTINRPNNINIEEKNKKEKNKVLPVVIVAVVILIFINIGMYMANFNDNINDIQSNTVSENQSTQDGISNDIYYNEESDDEEKIERDKEQNNVNVAKKRSNNVRMSSKPTVKKELPERYSEYGDYDSYTQQYFMEMEDLLTEYYTDYEKAVSNSDYSYVRGDLVDNGQLSKELKIAIPQYKNRNVYVTHFSIYNFDMYGEDEASFNLDTVFVVDGKKIQIETQRMTTYYDYYNQRWLIDNYTDWDIIYKQDYNPDVDYFDFTNYRDYF
ncbi:hypothetical protein [Peptacetobacter hiranonis]|uniref:hypothetical protein n=1 Tax=Peptacetobacter hiranonis TaxID=89152 RepID=UPI0022E48966|nr:hypothetical protein [Peptacetobacter hiranonis]